MNKKESQQNSKNKKENIFIKFAQPITAFGTVILAISAIFAIFWYLSQSEQRSQERFRNLLKEFADNDQWICKSAAENLAKDYPNEASKIFVHRLAKEEDRVFDLSGIDLSNADLEGAILTGASMEDTSLNGVNLSRAKLCDAKLAGVCITGADLAHTDLTDASFTSAPFGNRWVKLKSLPAEVRFPNHLKDTICYWPMEKFLIFKGPMSKSDRDELLELSRDINYRKAISELFNLCFERRIIGVRKVKDFTKTILKGVKGLSKEDIEYAKSIGAEVD